MSRHVIAIVGRPNVGKSTLFNRIIGEREAIVHDLPGVTRDRNYADTEWAGKTFTLIDTGGYLPTSSDMIEQAIREQASVAIEEADAIIFVVDGAEGLTPLDEEIAAILRKSNKHIHLVVNKIDSDKREPHVGQFFALGLGEPISLSAILGRKVGDFLDLLVEGISTNGQSKPDPRLRLAIIGKPNVGKSSLVNALTGEQRSIVTPLPGTTRDPVDTVIKHYGEEILLVDTAGLRRRSRIHESIEFFSALRTIKSIERCDVAVIVVDAVQGVDKQDLRIIQLVGERKRPVILAVNKWDLVEKDAKTAQVFEKRITALLRTLDYVPIIFISALTKQRVYKVLELAKEIHKEAGRRITTNDLNRDILAEIQKNPPSSSTGKEIKIKYVTQVKTYPPAFVFFANHPKLIDNSYKRFLERKIREHYGFRGVPISLYFRTKTR